MLALLKTGYFLFTLLMSFVIFVLWLRIALRFFKVSHLHPFFQNILRITNPIVRPFSSLLGEWGSGTLSRRIDWAAIVVLLLAEFIKYLGIGFFQYSSVIKLSLLGILILADLIVQPLTLLFYAVLIRALISWLNPNWNHPLTEVLRLLTEPLLKRARDIIPVSGGLDFSPVLVLIGLKTVTIFIIYSLPLQSLI